MPIYQPAQHLNVWVGMLHDIYGHSQNYAKTAFELHAHLTEVTGVLGKHLLKRKDPIGAAPFAAKSFAWACALYVKMTPGNFNMEDVILRKFPGVCPYCHESPCGCWQKTAKPTLDEGRIRNQFFKYAASARRTPNDLQLMLKQIYGASWGIGLDAVRAMFVKLLEELAEVGEAIRFAHLYPHNFENELADYLAWWFALVSIMHSVHPSGAERLPEELLWAVYPGRCTACDMLPCLCRPGPVRELISKPLPGELARLDRLTLAYNQAAYIEDVQAISIQQKALSVPASCVRIDLDDFKRVNDIYGHPAGDQALRHLASIIRQKVRERDRVYRVGGDEFVVLCSDYSKEEGVGAMRRVSVELRKRPVRWVSEAGEVSEFPITVSVGVAECGEATAIEAALEAADQAALQSKREGKSRVTSADK